MANDDPNVDFGAAAAGDKPNATSDLQEQPPVPRIPSPDKSFLNRTKYDDRERRGTRLIMYLVVLGFACLFLWKGLKLAESVGYGLLQAKQSIVTAMTEKDKINCPDPAKCIKDSNQNSNTSATTTAKAKGDTTKAKEGAVGTKEPSEAAKLNTDWLSASSLIAIVAIILGVGLTLILTLLKSTYQHPTDKELKRDKDTSTIEIATPLSQLIEQAIDYFKNKFSK